MKKKIMTDNPVWDAKRLVREYIKIAKDLEFAGGDFQKLDWADQIRSLRIASVISACTGEEMDQTNPLPAIGRVFNRTRSRMDYPLADDKYDTVMAMIHELIGGAYSMNHFDGDDRHRERFYVFEWLLRFRRQSYLLTQYASGLLAGNSGIFNALNVIRKLYFVPMAQADEQVDTLIAMLLGTPFEKTFLEEELISTYHFPTVTDRELDDWWIDNL